MWLHGDQGDGVIIGMSTLEELCENLMAAGSRRSTETASHGCFQTCLGFSGPQVSQLLPLDNPWQLETKKYNMMPNLLELIQNHLIFIFKLFLHVSDKLSWTSLQHNKHNDNDIFLSSPTLNVLHFPHFYIRML